MTTWSGAMPYLIRAIMWSIRCHLKTDRSYGLTVIFTKGTGHFLTQLWLVASALSEEVASILSEVMDSALSEVVNRYETAECGWRHNPAFQNG